MTEYLNSALSQIKRSGIREFTRLAGTVEGCMFLTLGEPDFNTPDIIKEQAKADLDANITHYPPNNGQPELLSAISEFEKRQNGYDYAPDEIIFTVGATEALFTALFGIINPGDEVIVPMPGYVLYEQLIKLCRGVCVPLETSDTGFQITEERLKSALSDKTKAIILTSPNNPTGCIYTPETLEMMRRVLAERKMFIICDDVYSRLVYTENYRSFASFREFRDRLIVIQSFAKPYAMTGWRAGYLMASREVKKAFEPIHQYAVVSASSFIQNACIKALDYDPSPMIEVYRKRRDYVLQRLEAMGLSVNRPEGAFYVFPSIARFGMGSMAFCTRLLHEAKLAVTPGESFGADDFFRISYSYSDEMLKEGMDRLERFVKSLEK